MVRRLGRHDRPHPEDGGGLLVMTEACVERVAEMRNRRGCILAFALAVALAGCAPTSDGGETTGTVRTSEPSEAPASPWRSGEPFPTAAFSDLSEDRVLAQAAA